MDNKCGECGLTFTASYDIGECEFRTLCKCGYGKFLLPECAAALYGVPRQDLLMAAMVQALKIVAVKVADIKDDGIATFEQNMSIVETT